jgi:hypothetical protein
MELVFGYFRFSLFVSYSGVACYLIVLLIFANIDQHLLINCPSDTTNYNPTDNKAGKKANTHTRIRKLTKTQQKNTNEKLHSITTCNKGNKSSEADSFRNKK